MALAAITATAVGSVLPDLGRRPKHFHCKCGAAQAPALPYGAGEVVKMYQGGINKDVIVNYINSTSLPYHLSADGIIYLQTLGVPQEITKAMIQRDGQLQQQQAAQQYYQQQQMPAATAAAMDLPRPNRLRRLRLPQRRRLPSR